MIPMDDAMKMVFDQAYKMPIIDKSLTGNENFQLLIYKDVF